ncbi:MAG: hypothetical protein LBS97_05835 [Treponema sp.]|jgi:hypothetical protein|nr:hypothetical protein [Treponema sp.]
MKKILVVLLMAALVLGSAFAADGFTVGADLITDAINYTVTEDDDNKASKTDSFTKSAMDTSELRIAFNLQADNYRGYLRLRTDSGAWVGNNPGSGIVYIDEYEVYGIIGPVKLMYANTHQRGIGRYGDIDDFLDGRGFGTTYNLGLFTPTFSGKDDAAALGLSAKDVNNITKNAYGTSNGRFFLGLAFGPISVTGALGPFTASKDEKPEPVSGKSAGEFALRVSGAKIADLVSFDVTYKYSETDPDTEKDETEITAGVPAKEFQNAFGLYANITPVSGLGFNVGYSGQFAGSDIKQEIAGPFWNGIDLQVKYTGVEKLTVTLNNNVSLASFKVDKATDGETGFYAPMNGATTQAQADVEESFFSLTDALVVSYAVTDKLTATVQIANQMANMGHTEGDTEQTMKYNLFGGYLGCTYTIAKGVTARGGIDFSTKATTVDNGANSNTYKSTIIAIPVAVKVSF